MQMTPRTRRSLMSRDLMDWAFDDFFRNPNAFEEQLSGMRGAAADVYETNDNVVVKMAIPGANPDDINIQVTGDTLTISGETRQEEEDADARYMQKQLYTGRFTQMVTLPSAIQPDKAEADFEHGILTLTMPKSEEVKPKTIKVHAAHNGEKKLL